MGKVRWDSTADQILLTKILETHEISVDAQRVAEVWPAEENSKPTARAIKERISKIKELSKKATTGGLSASSPSSARKTPRKQAAAKSSPFETPTKKRKRPSQARQDAEAKVAAFAEEAQESIEVDGSDDEEENPVHIKREKTEEETGVIIKIEDHDDQEVNVKPKMTAEQEEALFADDPVVVSSRSTADPQDNTFLQAPQLTPGLDNRFGQVDSRLRQTSRNPTLSSESAASSQTYTWPDREKSWA